MKLKFQGSQKRPIRVTISQKGLGKKFQKIHLFDNQYPKVNGIVTLFTVTNFRPVSTSSTYVPGMQPLARSPNPNSASTVRQLNQLEEGF